MVSQIRISRDEHALEGLPLKLIIIVLIMAISIPLIWGGLENYDRTQTENNLRSELDFLVTRAKQVYFGGVGNADNVEVNFKSGFFTKIEYIEIGDGPDGFWSSIRYKLNYKGVETIVIDNPNIPLANISYYNPQSPQPQPLKVSSGRYTIHLECRGDKDFTNDGNKDLYVEVRVVV